MAKIYAKRIIANQITLADVPAKLQQEVMRLVVELQQSVNER